MRKLTAGAALAVVLALVVLVTAWPNGGEPGARVVSFGAFRADTAYAAAPPDPGFSADLAESRARQLAVDFLTGEGGPTARIGGVPVTVQDLVVVESGFAAHATRVSFFATGSISQYPEPTNVWISVFRLPGVRAVEIELEDGTGRLLGAGAFMGD